MFGLQSAGVAELCALASALAAVATVVISFGSNGATARSARAAKDQAEAALKAANAALEQGVNLKLVERAYVDFMAHVPIGEGDQSKAPIGLKNTGKTPATILSVAVELYPEPPVLSEAPAAFLRHRALPINLTIATGETTYFTQCPTGGLARYWLVGVVAYRDVFGARNETTMALCFDLENQINMFFGPPDWNRMK